MLRIKKTVGLCLFPVALFAGTAEAELIGVLPATPGGTDYQAYYDDQLDISWTADANINGINTWANQVAWAASLDIDGVTGWRLPNMDVNGDDTVVSCTADQAACMDNEYGHLFNYGAGTVFGSGITASGPGPFSNVQSAYYWSGTEFAPNPTAVAQLFNFYRGFQDAGGKGGDNFAWAVHSGNVGDAGTAEGELINALTLCQAIELAGTGNYATCLPTSPEPFPQENFVLQGETDQLLLIDGGQTAITLLMTNGVPPEDIEGIGFRLIGLRSTSSTIEIGDIEYLGEWTSFPRSLPFIINDDALGATLEWTDLTGADPFRQGAAIRINLIFGDVNGDKPPVADAGGPYTGIAGAEVFFDGSDSFDSDGGTIEQYDWRFDDSGTGTGAQLSHVYATAGTYNVTLTVTDSDGLSDSITTTANIGASSSPPTANAGGSYEGTEGKAVTFDGSFSTDLEGPIAQYDWDYGDLTAPGINAGPNPTHTYAANGEYTVTLTVTDSDGETDDDIATATILIGNIAPTADAGPPAEGVLGDTVSFDGSNSNDPDGTIAQYDWDFGDTTTGTGVNPSHLYAAPGDYTVLLTVTDDDGTQSSVATTAATISAAPLEPTANAGDPVVGTAGVAVSFNGGESTDADGTIEQYDWDYGDLTAPDINAGPNPTHTYAEAGSYTVTLTVTDSEGLTDTDETQAAIDQANTPPTADAGGSYGAAVNTLIVFNGSASDDPDGIITQYDWDYGDSTTGSGLTSGHTYTAPGSYTATLTVTDNDGGTDESHAKVIIGDAAKVPPRPFTNGPYNGVAGVPLTVDARNFTDPDGTNNIYNWTFGDGNRATGPTQDNTYVSGGLYSVLLQVTDDGGLTASDGTIAAIGNLSLLPNAAANATNEPYKGRVGVPVAFNGGDSNDPDGDIVRLDWEFGDGNVANDAGPLTAHVYATSGRYIAKLTVTDDTGETDTDVTVVSVGIGNLPPVSIAGVTTVNGTAGNPITFDGSGSYDPDGSIDNYAWRFGDGNTATGPNPTPTHSYTVAGKYFVTLTVTDNDGVVSSNVILADVAPAASADGSNSRGGGGGGGCSLVSGGTNDPTLPLLLAISIIYLARKRYPVGRRLS